MCHDDVSRVLFSDSCCFSFFGFASLHRDIDGGDVFVRARDRGRRLETEPERAIVHARQRGDLEARLAADVVAERLIIRAGPHGGGEVVGGPIAVGQGRPRVAELPSRPPPNRRSSQNASASRPSTTTRNSRILGPVCPSPNKVSKITPPCVPGVWRVDRDRPNG